MKTRIAVAALFFLIIKVAAQTINVGQLSPQPASATPPQDTPYAIVENDANSRLWQRTTYEQLPSGEFLPHVHWYREVATGLNYQDENGQWRQSSETIEPVAGGAVASHGQHKVTFAANLATSGAIDLETPDGQRLQSHLLGLSYFDRASGQTVFIAVVTNSIGQLISSNQVFYDNAFDGVKAGVRYTYTRAGFEQDVILEEQPPAPEAYGLNSSTTVLQSYTEFLSPPAPDISVGFIPAGGADQLQDETLSFHTMRIGRGRAFLMGDSAQSSPVAKEWANIGGRQFLIEEVSISQIADQLRALPPSANASVVHSNSVLNVVSTRRLLPSAPLAKTGTNEIRFASLSSKNSGFVLDYSSVITSQTNCIFRGDTTYYVSANVNLCGTNTTFEGGTVLKYASNVTLTVNTPITWGDTTYHPVLMVAKDDNSSAETIPGSTGNPGTNYYAAEALCFNGSAAHTNLNIDNLRVLNAQAAVVINGWTNHVLSNVQIAKCANGIVATNADFSLRNALMSVVLTNFSGSPTSIGHVEHLTSDVAAWLNNGIGTNLFLTNCILSAVTNLGNCHTQSVAIVSSGAGVFQSVGGGGYYLADNSPYRDFGTTNINPALAAQLSRQTTYPPALVLNTDFNSVTTLGPTVARDTNAPDLGYHYDPMDYVFSGVNVNTNLTFSAGTAVGWFKPTSGNAYAIHLADKAVVTFDGQFAAEDDFVRTTTVQEGNTIWGGVSGFGIVGSQNQSSQDITLSSEIDMNFTRMTVLIWDQQFRDYSGYLIARANNSIFAGGNCGGYVLSSYFTNCLMDNQQVGTVEGDPGNEVYLRNCTLHNGIFYGHRTGGAIPITVRDCIFDNVTLNGVFDSYSNSPTYTYYNYNAYPNATDPFPNPLEITNDQQSVTFNWQTGPLGNFYLPTNSPLINKGDTNADKVGLYHFTTQTDLAKEGNSIVDIGYHYVATDCGPLDTVWVDDALPAGAIGHSDGGDAWTWISSNPAPFSGQVASQSNVAGPGEHQHYFLNATAKLTVNSGETLIAYVYLDPIYTPSEVMLQWNDGSWEHRAYWGANDLSGWAGHYIGVLPPAGQWVRLEVPASVVGLEGHTLNGMAFTLFGGRATWDYAGKSGISCYDSDGDGIPDYIEDANGNGQVDAGESSWLLGIDSQPQSINAVQGQNVTFSVVAGGVTPFSYQWRSNGAAIAGATNSTFTKLVVTTADEANYSVVVTNVTGAVTSAVATLTVNSPLRITDPTNATIVAGNETNFSVSLVTGNYPNYQWYTNNTKIDDGTRIFGATTGTLSISNASAADQFDYTAVVTNLFNGVTSAPASLTVISHPNVTSAATNTTAVQSDDVILSAVVTGGELHYQWWLTNTFGTNSILGATDPVYTKLVVQTNDAGHYCLAVTNLAGITNVNADLSVLVPPWITRQPASVVTNQGSNVTFSISAFGTTNLFYQWFKNGTNALPSATNSFLTLSGVQTNDIGGYSVCVTNIAGTNQSAWAWLSVISSGGSTNNGWGSGAQPSPTNHVAMIGPTNTLPSNPAIYLYGRPISIRASAWSQYSCITNVAFYYTGTNYQTNFLLAGTAIPGANSKFALAWTNALPGTNILKAEAWDASGHTTNAALVYVIMDRAPQVVTIASTTNVLWEGSSTNVWVTNYVTDDGLPYGITNISWNLPAGVTVSDHYTYTASNIVIASQATFTNSGMFQLQLNVSDGFVSTASSCTVWLKHRPTVSFNFPTNNSAFLTGTPIVLNVTATDPDGTVTNVTFHDDVLATNYTAVQTVHDGWVYAWYDAPLWTNVVSAIATDDDGLTSTSQVTVVIFPPLAVKILSPVSGQVLLARSNATVTATVTNIMPGTTIDWVEFFAGSESAGYAVAASNLVYQFPWIPTSGGTYALSAQAVEHGGGGANSSPVTVSVRDVPFVAIANPTNTEMFSYSPTNLTISATVVTNGASVTNITFYQGTNVIGMTDSSPYSVLWTNVTAGTYHLNAKVIDTGGMIGISSNITVIVELTNRAPSVDPGQNQTNYLSTNAVPLIGIVSDDGLPFGSSLSTVWTNLNGGTNVTFVNSNLPVTSAYFWSTGSYMLRLSVSDSQFTIASNVMVTVLPANRPPNVDAGTNQTLILPAAPGSNIVQTVPLSVIAETESPLAKGIDYFPSSNCLIASVQGDPSFVLIYTNGWVTNFSTISNLNDEVYIATVRNTMGGFKVGEFFSGGGTNGEIMRIEPDGTAIGTNQWTDSMGNLQSNAWVVLRRTNEDGTPINQGRFRGGLWVDRTGVWGGDLIACAVTSEFGTGHVWRVNSSGQATFVADVTGGDYYEGVTTIPDDVSKYGPWAGRILIGGDDDTRPIFAIDTNGVVTEFNLGIGGEDIRVVPQGESFFGVDDSVGGSSIYGASAASFQGLEGDIIATAEDGLGGYMYRVHWNGTAFEVNPIGKIGAGWEGANFMPSGVSGVTAWTVQLTGAVSDDGEINGITSNYWSVVSGPGKANIVDPSQTNTLAGFSEPGDYVLQLSAFDGQYTSNKTVTIHVLQNVAPIVSAGTNRIINTNIISLQGSVSDDGLPFGTTNIYWTILSAPNGDTNNARFGSMSDPTSQVTFFSQGTYLFRLTADDGQVSTSADIMFSVEAASLVLSPAVGIAARTNTIATVSASLVNPDGTPAVNATVHFEVTEGPASGQSQDILSDSNGLATFTFTNEWYGSAQNGRDTITASATTSGGLNVTAIPVYKDWGFDLGCGDVYQDQQILSGLNAESREFPGHAAEYYIFSGQIGEKIDLQLTQVNLPFILVLRDATSDTVVAQTEPSFSAIDNVVSLAYTCIENGDYVAEVVSTFEGQEISGQYDLQLTCEGAAMQIWNDQKQVPNQGAVVFPITTQGVATNILLTITNAGSKAFTITGALTNGDFTLSNNVVGDVIAPGGQTNLGVIFHATASGISFGTVVLTPDTGSNQVACLQASTFPTDAVPTVQLISPTNGSVFAAGENIQYVAKISGGSVGVEAGYVASITTNGLFFPDYSSLAFDGGEFYTNSYVASNWPTVGDSSITAIGVDLNGQTNASPPVLIHIIPDLDTHQTDVPLLDSFYQGTNVPNGGTIALPQTVPGVPTNAVLVISNAGYYPVAITNISMSGDFNLSADTVSNLIGGPLSPGLATNIQVIFNASAHGDSVGDLVIKDNEKNGGTYSIYLTGSAYNYDETPSSATNLPPVTANDTFSVQANSENNLLDPLANDSDPNGDTLKIVALFKKHNDVTNGLVAITDNGRHLSYSPPPNARSYPGFPSDGFDYGVVDGHGGSNWGTVLIHIDATDVPEVAITSPGSGDAVTAGSIVPISVTTTNSPNVVRVDLYCGNDKVAEITNGINGVYTTNWTALYNNDDGGNVFVATATDKYGQVGVSGPIIINVSAPPGGMNLIASLSQIVDASGTVPLNPTNVTVIRDGLFNLYGTATNSAGGNVTWQAGLYLADGTLVRDLTPASTSSVGTADASGILLTNCDLSTVENGVYFLRLTVMGDYQMTDTSVQIELESNLKIGQFSFSQQDLVVPLSGIPLTVVRTYNSLKPTRGDFGYGWTYSLNDMDVSLDESRNDVEDLDGNTFSERSGGGRDVTLTLPDGQRTTFYFNLEQGDNGTYRAVWTAAPGVRATLGVLGQNGLETIVGGVVGDSSLFYWDATGPGIPMDAYDFPGFVLTNKDGTTYRVDRDDLGEHFIVDGDEPGGGHYVHAYGDAHLTEIKTLAGDRTDISLDSVVSTASNNVSHQITFERNEHGLITAVRDPVGVSNTNAPPAVKYDYDSSDNLIAVERLVDRDAGTYVTNSFTYTNTVFPHYITGILNADGTQVAKNFYDDSGKLIAVQDADGNKTQFVHNPTNDMEIVVDRRGYTNTYIYDLRGNVTAQTNQVGEVTTMAYDEWNNKTNEVTYLNGSPYATNRYVYDTNLNVVLVSYDALGHSNEFYYDSAGRLTNSIDALGHATTNVYDAAGNLIETMDALGHSTRSSYSGSLLLGSVDAIGTLTTNAYDGNNNLIGTATIDAFDKIVSSNSFTYDDDNNRLTSTVWRRVNGTWTPATTTNVYDAMNRVVQTINPDGGTNTTVYDADGRQQATIDPLGRTNNYTYDNQGRVKVTTYPDGTTEQSFYDNNGNRSSSVDKADRTTFYVYDALNRLTQTIYPDDTTNTTVYDPLGRVAQTIDARGAITAYDYDVAGRRLAVTNAFGTPIQMVSQYTYDANGNQIIFTDAANHCTTNIFDALNRQVQTGFANGTSTSTGFDAGGRKVAGTNQDGIVTLFGYDGAGRLIVVTNAWNTTEQMVTRYQYDEAGNETAQIDALNRTNTFNYNQMGRRVLHTRPDGGSQGFTYDVAGNLIYQTNCDSNVILSQYDDLNRLTNRTLTTGDHARPLAGFTYTPTGQRSSATNYGGFGSVYVYDSRDRQTQKISSWMSGMGLSADLTASLNYAYDADGNLTNLSSSMAEGVDLAYGYDVLNRITNVLSHGQLAASYSFDTVGNLSGLRYGNGVTNLYQYDTLNRLTNLVWKYHSGALGSFYYQLGKTGNRTNLSETVNATGRNYSWAYDRLYRMTNETISGIGGVAYQFDIVGNRTSRNSTNSVLPPATYGYNTNDWLTSDSYDTNGNTTASGSATYVYDVQNRLIQSGLDSYLYDADGNRVAKTPDGNNTFTYYQVDDRNPTGYPQVVEEYRVTQPNYTLAYLDRTYTYGLALISEQQFDTNTFLPSVTSYYGFDGHGSVRLLTATNGSITDTYAYDAYGTTIASSGSTPNDYLYTGEQFDPDLGMYYLRARYYRPDTGRFWTADIFEGNNEDPLSLHKYLYGANNPINRIDPSGHDSLVELMTTISISAAVSSLNTVAVLAASGAKGRLPDAYIVGAYFAAGISLPGEIEGGPVFGGYYVYDPHLKKRAFYLFGAGEISGDFNPIEEAEHHAEAGVFEMWDWGFPGFQQESFNFFKPLLGGVDVKGSLYGAEWSGSGEQALLFGVSSSKSVSWFGIGSEYPQLRTTQNETAGAMAVEVAIDHTLISGLETQNTFSGLNVIGQILGAGLNGGAAAYWVNHEYGQ